MTLEEFLQQTQAEIRERMAEGGTSPYTETVFADRVMEHLAEIGMTSDPVTCHYAQRVDRAELRLSGYAVGEEGDQLDLFVSLYLGVEVPTPIPDKETLTAADRCLRFLTGCVEGNLASRMDPSNDAYALAETVRTTYPELERITIHVLTDRVAKSKQFKDREVGGKSVRIEVMDIERLHRHLSEGRPRDEVVMDFGALSGGPIPCVLVPGEEAGYATVLAAVPGEALRTTYERFGARLLEANVRSFLAATGKVNRGIRDTLRTAPGDFMAYNNGVVLVADAAAYGTTAEGGPGLSWLRGVQVVNGGQTTASIYFTKRRAPDTDLRRVRVPAKIIILAGQEDAQAEAARETLVASVSRFANSQNAVKLSDLSANRPFQRGLEQLSQTTYCPDGRTRWFYERAAGSYNVMLARRGDTPARLKALKAEFPPDRRIGKTDLAKCLMAWAGEPHVVSQGLQKNFERFNVILDAEEDGTARWPARTPQDYKQLVAQVIVFRTVQKVVRPLLQAFQANAIAYTVALLGRRIGDRIDLDRVWAEQAFVPPVPGMIRDWALAVDRALHRTGGGRMISEWAKKPECWEQLRGIDLSMDGMAAGKRTAG